MNSSALRTLLGVLFVLLALAAAVVVFFTVTSATPEMPVVEAGTASEREAEAETRLDDLKSQLDHFVEADREVAREALSSGPARSGPAENTAPPAVFDGSATVLAGRVVDAAGQPVADARVGRIEIPEGVGTLFSVDGLEEFAPMEETTRTDEEGRFSLAAVGAEKGTFTLVAKKRGYPAGKVRGQIGEVPAHVERIEIMLPPAASVRGFVVGVPDDLDHVHVVARKKRQTSNTAFLSMNLNSVVGGVPSNFTIVPSLNAGEEGWAFELSGLEVDTEYEIYGLLSLNDGQESTTRPTVIAPSAGVVLHWRAPSRIRAQFLDAATGGPLSGVVASAGRAQEIKVFGMGVPLLQLSDRPERSDETGEILVDVGTDSEQRPVTVEFRLDGYRPERIEGIEAREAGVIDLGEIRLRAAPVLTVTVLADATGEPVVGARVALEEPVEIDGEEDNQVQFGVSVGASRDSGAREEGPQIQTFGEDGGLASATTDEAGVARLTWVPESELDLHVEADDFAPFVVERQPVPGPRGADLEVRLFRGGEVRLIVVDADGAPLAGAQIETRERDATELVPDETDADGRLSLERLKPGSHWFRLASGRSSIRMRMDARVGLGEFDSYGWTEVVVTEGGTHEVVLEAPRKVLVTGVVQMDGEPLDRAQVRFLFGPGAQGGNLQAAMQEMVMEQMGGVLSLVGEKGPPSSKTGPEGSFELEDIPVGSHRLLVRHPDCAMPYVEAVEVVDGPNSFYLVIPGTSVRGYAVDTAGQPVEGVQVSLVPVASDADVDDSRLDGLADARSMIGSLFGGSAHAGVRTDENGEFVLRGVQPGTRLRVTLTDRWHERRGITVGPLVEGAPLPPLQLVMRPAGRVSVRAPGREIGDLRAEWAGPDDGDAPRERTTLLRNGSGVLEGLRPGVWTITVGGPAGDAEHKDVTVRARETEKIEF